MKNKKGDWTRREFIKMGLGGLAFTVINPFDLSLRCNGNNNQSINFSGSSESDLLELCKRNKIAAKRFESPKEAIELALNGSGVIITAPEYPSSEVEITNALYKKAAQKDIRLFVEYPARIPGKEAGDAIKNRLKRGVITSGSFGSQLPEMSLLGLHECYFLPAKMSGKPLISFAKVAGFNKAKYGLKNTEAYPLLFKRGNVMVAMTSLTSFMTARYRPNALWRILWENILGWLTETSNLWLRHWIADPRPMYDKYSKLPANARRKSVSKGAEWIFNARFLIHPSWKDMVLSYQRNGRQPWGPPVGENKLIGDGSLGILEGQASKINYDGSQQYRYWLRCDVQGGSAFLLASAGDFVTNSSYKTVSESLIDYIFYTSKFRQGPRGDKEASVYGLLSWAATDPGVFYADDNARCILGVAGASACLPRQRWDRFIVENILANFRLSSKQGFFGPRLGQKQVIKKGWKYFNQRDLTYLNPHFQAWPWACFLWLYGRTGYKPLLTKTKEAIQITMEGYPDKWLWQNGMQQERARMILPLAWLVRIDDNPQHKKWLDFMIGELLKYQQPCGAIREDLGQTGKGLAAGPKSNKAYGKSETPLIAKDGDPVSDMLYTCNFAFFALNEAAHATGSKKYAKATGKLSDFLTRIQIKSDRHSYLDGGWFRAFDYKLWDYWASNADIGWGAWCTEVGWTQSWIVATQVLKENDTCYWELTKKSSVDQYMDQSVELMLNK